MSEARDFVFPLLSKNRTVQALTIAAASIFSPFAGAALSMWYGQRNARDAKRRARSQYLAGLTGRSQMFRSPVANRQVIYGRAKVSGPVLFVGTTGVAAENLYMVIALAGHEIQGFDTVWFNEEPLGLDAGGNVVAGKYFRGRTEAWDLPMGNTAGSTLTVPDVTNLQLFQEDPAPENGGRTQALTLGTHYTVAGSVVTLVAPLYAGQPIRASGTRTVGTSLANVRVYTGTDTQTADAELMAQFPTQWTSAHRLRGVAYAIVRLSYDPNVFQGGVPNIAFTVFGKKVFDPRSSTTTYSNNWALCVHDYLRSAEGGNFSAAEIDTASIIAAANVSDELVPLAAGGSQPRYTLDGAFELATSPEELLPDMLTAGNGSAIYQQGKWTLKAGAYTAPVLALNENDLAGGVSIVPEASAFDLFNAVKGTFIDPQRSWQPSEFPLVANALYETADGGERKELDLTLLYTQDATRAQRIAKQLLDRSRLALTCTAEFNLKAFRLQAGDTITLSIARYGWVNKIFMIRQREFNFATQRVTLTLQEEAAAAYNWAGGDALAYDPAPNTTLPQPWNIPAPASAAATSGNNTLVRLDDGTIVPQIQVTWTQPTNIYVLRNGRTEVEYRRVVDAAWRRIEVRGDAAAAFLPDVQEASAYSIRLRHVLDNGTTSDWTILSPHTVVGKSAPPPDATSLSVTRLTNGMRRFVVGVPSGLPLDIAGAQIRFNSGASLGPWASAARLGQNLPLLTTDAGTGVGFDRNEPGPGQWTFGVRLLDTSGNLSTNTLTTTVTLGPVLDEVSLRRNLIDSSWWAPGVSLASRWREENDTSVTQVFAVVTGPDGRPTIVLRATEAGTNSNAGGGFNESTDAERTNRFAVDPTRRYFFAIPVRRINDLAASSLLYLGAQEIEGAPQVQNGAGASDPNPYFIGGVSGSLLARNRWHLMCGEVFPSGVTDFTGSSGGLYDMVTGQRVALANSFRWAAGAATGRYYLRAYQYNAPQNASVEFGPPMVFMCDGSEPSVSDLINQYRSNRAQYRVTSVGSAANAAGTSPVSAGLRSLNDGETLAAAAQFYTVARFSRATGAYLGASVFIPRNSVPDAAAMAAHLNGLGNDVIVVIFTFDEPADNRLLGGLPAAMYRCGASSGVWGSRMLTQSAYILIGVPGVGEGNGFEAYRGDVVSDPNAWVDVSFYIENGQPIVPGSKAQVRIDSTNVTTYVGPNTVNTREINPGAVTVVSDTKPTDVSSSRSAVGTTTTAIATLSFANTTGETQQVLVNYYALHTGTAGVTGSADATTLTRITGAVRVSGVTYTGQPAEFREFERGSLALGSNDFTQDHGGSFVVSVPTGSTATVTYEHAIINVGPGCASNLTSRGISMSLAVLKR